MSRPERRQIDAMAQSFGYQHLGGMATNRVYLHQERGEVLKVAVGSDPTTIEYARAQFQRCLAISKHYAAKDIMPEVLEVGGDFHGTGCPWLRERYISGQNLGAAYLEDPAFWTDNAPREIVRLIEAMAQTHSEDVAATWHSKMAGMVCPQGYEHIYSAVAKAGTHLAERYTEGHIIHGDLQFGNILVRRTEEACHMWLIDWEVSEVMPLGYEFAMLYTFLMGPEDQVEEQYEQQYSQIKPLRAFWSALAPRLLNDLGIGEDELKNSVVFRMGNAWLYQLNRALQQGNTARAAELEDSLQSLVSHQCFDLLPYP